MKILVTFFLLFFSFSVKGEETTFYKNFALDSELEKDFRLFSFNLSLTQKPQPKSLYFSFGSLGLTNTSTRNVTDTETTVTNSRDSNINLAVAYDENFEFLINAGQNSSAETKFQKRYKNLEITLSKAGDESSYPHFGLTAIAGSAEIQQTINFQIFNTYFERVQELNQSVLGARLSLSPFDFFKFKFSLKSYSYSESKEDLQKAYSNIFLNKKTSALVSTIGGLPENSLDLAINYFLNDLYSFEFFYGTSLLIITDNKDQKFGFILSRFFENFAGNIGLSQNKTESMQTTSLLIGASIDF